MAEDIRNTQGSNGSQGTAGAAGTGAGASASGTAGGAAAGGSGDTGAGAAGGGGSWSMPEKFAGKSVEDVARAYTDLERQYSQAAQYRGLYDQIQQYGGLENLVAWATQGFQAAQAAQQQQQQPQAPQQQPTQQQQQAWWNDWDVKTPQEQALTMYQVLGGVVQNYVNQIAQQYAQGIQSWQSQQAREWDIYRRVMKAARSNPDIDEERLLAEMLQVAQAGPQQLQDIALQKLTAPSTMEKQLNERVAAIRADLEQKMRNQAMGSLPQQGRQTYQAPQVYGSKAEENQALLRSMVDKGIISPGQI